MCLLSALEIPEARALVQQYLDEATRELAELRSITEGADAGAHPRGRMRFGRLAAEYGVHQGRALQQWAEWALHQLGEAERTCPVTVDVTA